MITQFFGHIVRGEEIKLVDGGTQKRAFTYIDDGIDALMKIIENPEGIANGKIYNVGNPLNNYSVRELAQMMLDLALTYPEYRDTAKLVKLVDTTASEYYGKGYQDVQNRVPKIENTCRELAWKPTFTMDQALRKIYDAYRGQIAEARGLVDWILGARQHPTQRRRGRGGRRGNRISLLAPQRWFATQQPMCIDFRSCDLCGSIF